MIGWGERVLIRCGQGMLTGCVDRVGCVVLFTPATISAITLWSSNKVG